MQWGMNAFYFQPLTLLPLLRSGDYAFREEGGHGDGDDGRRAEQEAATRPRGICATNFHVSGKNFELCPLFSTFFY